jgi:hypothetical protein
MERAAQLSPTSTIEGLAAYELGALVSIAGKLDDQDDAIAVSSIRQGMESAGFTDIATTLALRALLGKGMIEVKEAHDDYGNEYKAYGTTKEGMAWLIQNIDKLTMTQPPPPPASFDEDPTPF